MHTKFYLHVCYCWREEAEKCLRLFFVVYKHVVIMQICCLGNDVISMRTEFHLCVLLLVCLRSEEVNLRQVPEAICCCLLTCIVVIMMLVIEYIMYTKIRSHSS